jgi:hypothetical protein
MKKYLIWTVPAVVIIVLSYYVISFIRLPEMIIAESPFVLKNGMMESIIHTSLDGNHCIGVVSDDGCWKEISSGLSSTSSGGEYILNIGQPGTYGDSIPYYHHIGNLIGSESVVLKASYFANTEVCNAKLVVLRDVRHSGF